MKKLLYQYRYPLFLTTVLAFLLFGLQSFIKPLILATTLSYILNRPVSYLEKRRIARPISAIFFIIVLILILFLFMVFFIPILNQKILQIIRKVPLFVNYVQHFISSMIENIFSKDQTYATKFESQIQDQASTVLKYTLYSVLNWVTLINLQNLVYYFIVLPFLIYYLTIDWPYIVQWLHSLIPVQYQGKSKKIAGNIDKIFFLYFKGQSIICLVLIVLYSMSLYLVGLKDAFVIGPIIGVLCFIPYLGAIVGFLLIFIFACADAYSGSILLWSLIVFCTLNMIEGNILVPKFIGETLGVPSLVLILSIIIGYRYFGFFGVFLSYPTTAALISYYKEARRT